MRQRKSWLATPSQNSLPIKREKQKVNDHRNPKSSPSLGGRFKSFWKGLKEIDKTQALSHHEALADHNTPYSPLSLLQKAESNIGKFGGVRVPNRASSPSVSQHLVNKLAKPPNKEPDIGVFTAPTLFDFWERATLLFNSFEIEESIILFHQILNAVTKSSTSSHERHLLYANLGILRYHLGEYHLAAQLLSNAVRLRPQRSIYWFLLGCIHWEHEQYQRAALYFEACLSTLPAGVEETDYRVQGLQFVLAKKAVEWNWRMAEHRNGKMETNEQSLASIEFGKFGIWRMPGGRIFAPE